MKILYSAGNRLGACHQLYDFLANFTFTNNSTKIAVAAYARQIKQIKQLPKIKYLNWNLDALHANYERPALANSFGYASIPALASQEADLLIDEISDFNPDLVICDAEPIISYIAKLLDKKLIYISPIHLLDGLEHERYTFTSYAGPIDDTRRILRRLPPADQIFIYSPFGDLENSLAIKPGYSWISPYFTSTTSIADSIADSIAETSKYDNFILNCCDPIRASELNKLLLQLEIKSMLFKNVEDPGYRSMLDICSWYFCTGQTQFITDALYAGKPLGVAPNLNDPETIINAALVNKLNLGSDLGQVELMENLGIEEVERAYLNKPTLQPLVPKNKKLHEILEEFLK